MRKFREFFLKISLTILPKCHLLQNLNETNGKGCENGLNVCKFMKDIVVIKRPRK
jgi:hypothetical protein